MVRRAAYSFIYGFVFSIEICAYILTNLSTDASTKEMLDCVSYESDAKMF